MHQRTGWGGLPTTLLALTVTSAVAGGCTGVVDGSRNHSQGGGGASANGGSGPTTSAGTGMIQGPDGKPIACDGNPVSDSKRLVRLSFNQISNTIHSLFGDTFGKKVDTDFEIGPEAAVGRTFPPLASPREGSLIGKTIWPTNDQIASAAGAYTLANLNAVTACGAAPTDDCAQTFVKTFAEKAYRRPLTAAETTSLTQVYTEVKAVYGTVPEAIQYSVYALVQSPQMLYRTEFGANQAEAGTLTSAEIASSLSYFLTDGPPAPASGGSARLPRRRSAECRPTPSWRPALRA